MPKKRPPALPHLFVSLAMILCTAAGLSAAEKPNVLFIAVDDLRPQLNSYGKKFMHTPNFDRLAKRGVLFERAYCMVPTCGASRASMMTGIRPAQQRFKTYTTRADQDTPNAVTLNTFFKQHGYTTISLGKIFHNPQDNVKGWSEKPWRASGPGWMDQAAEKAAIAAHKKKYPKRTKVRGAAYESVDVPDEKYRDGQLTTETVKRLQGFARSGESFFLATGFQKPHLPFVAPKKYWDLYDFDDIQVPDNYQIPTNVPQGATHTSGELRAYGGIPPKGPVSDKLARTLIHGYYACVSFVDAQLGRMLDALDETGLHKNTMVVLWGDHGWNLGEHGMWNKHSCFETSMHAPLMVAGPGVKGGTRVRALVEFIDVYPTLCELTALPAPPGQLEGLSLTPLMRNPQAKWKTQAVTRFQTGDTIRTHRYRLSEYRSRGSLVGHMLYDHQKDPNENRNIAGSPENAALVERLSKTLNRIKGK